MPCRSDWDDGDYREYQREIDKVTNYLCSLLTYLEEDFPEVSHKVLNLNVGLKGWWKRHKAADDKRRNEEELEKNKIKWRKEALKKLTPYERSLLGLNEDES